MWGAFVRWPLKIGVFYVVCTKIFCVGSYLGHTKSSGSSTYFAYEKLKIIFFLYKKIESLLPYFSMLFDHYSCNIIVIKF